MTISFIGSAINATGTGATVNVSGTGRTSGDMIVLIDHAYSTNGAGIPTNVVPAGFTQIDTQTNVTAFSLRATTSFKVSNGAEGSLTGMAPDTEHDFEALVFRSTIGFGTPAGPVFDHDVTTNLTITSPGGVFAAVGCEDAGTSVQDWASSPAEDAQIYNNVGTSSTAGYKIFNSAPANFVLTGSANRNVKQGFVVPEASSGDTLMGQAVM